MIVMPQIHLLLIPLFTPYLLLLVEGGQVHGRGGGRMGRREGRFCEFYNSPGHVEVKCWSKLDKANWAKASSNASNLAPLLPTPTTTKPPAASNTVTLTHDDFDSFLKLAHGDTTLPSTSKACLSTHTSHSTWLIDSGASDHNER